MSEPKKALVEGLKVEEPNAADPCQCGHRLDHHDEMNGCMIVEHDEICKCPNFVAAQHLKREQEPAPLLIDLATKWLREQAETQCFTNDFRPSHRDSLVKLLSEVAAQPPQELVSLREAAKYARKVAFGMAYRCGHPRGGCPNHCDLLWAAIHQLDKARAALTRGAVGK